MRKVIVYPHHMRDSTAKRFAEHFGTKRVFPNRNYTPKRNHVILNWGNSTNPAWGSNRCISIINTPEAVRRAIDKKRALTLFRDHQVWCPFVWEWPSIEEELLRSKFSNHVEDYPPFLARTLNSSFGGKGIVPVYRYEDIPEDTKFLSEYIPKDREYRVHVFDRKVIAVQQKRKRRGEERDPYVWNGHTGSVLVVNNIQDISGYHFDKCIKAVNLLGLHFGAVDLGYDSKIDKSVVYEVNTAPGIRGKKVFDAYINAILELIGD